VLLLLLLALALARALLLLLVLLLVLALLAEKPPAMVVAVALEEPQAPMEEPQAPAQSRAAVLVEARLPAARPPLAEVGLHGTLAANCLPHPHKAKHQKMRMSSWKKPLDWRISLPPQILKTKMHSPYSSSSLDASGGSHPHTHRSLIPNLSPHPS